MSDRAKNYELNHREFIILGLISEMPSHAYNINQRIEDRGMRAWTNIGKSSVYSDLANLEKAGLVAYHNEEKDNRIRKVYTINEQGSKRLENKVYNILSEFTGRDENFYVAFSLLPILTRELQIKAINTSMTKIRYHITELEKMLEKNSKMPLNVRGLFVHPIRILETDLKFLEWVLKEIKEGKGNFGPEAYSK